VALNGKETTGVGITEIAFRAEPRFSTVTASFVQQILIIDNQVAR
jgi:hypothetical protein